MSRRALVRRRRRASGSAWTPRNLPGLALFLDAKFEAGRRGYSIGDSVVSLDQWSDDSPEGNHVTQGTAAAQPVLTDDGTRPLVRGDGVDDALYNATAPAGPSQVTTIVAHRTAVITADSLVQLGDADVGPGSHWHTTPEYAVRVNGGSTVFDTAADNTPSIVSTRMGPGGNATDIEGWLNGSALGVASETAQAAALADGATVFAVSRSGSPFEAFIAADIYAVIICSTALSDTDRQRAERWLNTRYALGAL